MTSEQATTACCSMLPLLLSNFRNQIRGRMKGIPGLGKSLPEAQWEQMKGNCPTSGPRQHEEVGNG